MHYGNLSLYCASSIRCTVETFSRKLSEAMLIPVSNYYKHGNSGKLGANEGMPRGKVRRVNIFEIR